MPKPHRHHAPWAPTPAGPPPAQRQHLLHHARRCAGGDLQRLSSARPPRHAIASTSCPRRRRQCARHAPPAARPPQTGPDSPYRRLVPLPHSGRRRQHTVATQHIKQLHRLIRIAGRMRADHLDQTRRRGRLHASFSATIVTRARHRQVDQPQVLSPRPVHAMGTAAPPADAPHPRPPRGRRPPAAGPRPAPRSAPGRRRRAGVRPAHCRSSTNTTSGRFREATARSTATPSRCARTCAVSDPPASGRHPQQRRELRHRRGHQPRVRPRPPPRYAADLGQLIGRQGQHHLASPRIRGITASNDRS